MEQPDPKHYNDFLQGAIQILDTLVLSIELPPAIVDAINRQTEQFYLIQEYKFRVEREAEESKRKQIEANGIAAFQQTVSKGISDSYLRWRGIEATLALAQSQNSKIVVIGAARTACRSFSTPIPGRRERRRRPARTARRRRRRRPPRPNRPRAVRPAARATAAPPAKSSNVSMPPASDKISGSAAFGRRNAFRCAGGAGRTEPQRSFRRRIDTFAN